MNEHRDLFASQRGHPLDILQGGFYTLAAGAVEPDGGEMVIAAPVTTPTAPKTKRREPSGGFSVVTPYQDTAAELASYQVTAEAELRATFYRPDGTRHPAPDSAADMVIKAFRESQPKDTSLPFTKVLSAKFTKTTSPRTAVATLEMFDGKTAVAEVSEILWKMDSGVKGVDPLNGTMVRAVKIFVSYSTGWLKMEGGACAVRGGEWVRVAVPDLLAA
jgi:hypothetical protein